MKKALIILAEGFEEIEAIAPIDILRRAKIEVTIAGLGAHMIKSARGITIATDIALTDYKGLPDVLILPGGSLGAMNLAASIDVLALIKKCFTEGKLVAAICASPAHSLLASGIIKGKKVTCYPGCEERLKESIYVDDPVVIDGNIITSQGPATAALFSFAIVEKLLGKAQAESVKKGMLFD